MGEQAAALDSASRQTERPVVSSGLAVQLHKQEAPNTKWRQSPATLFVLAGVSNMCGAAVTNPVNVVKVRMQLDGALSIQGAAHERVYPGFLKGIMRVATEEGLQGLWRGTGAALLREASYSSIRMGAYEPLKKALGADNPAHTPLWIKVAAGALAGTIGSAIANPTDVIMIRMQAPALSTTNAGLRLDLSIYQNFVKSLCVDLKLVVDSATVSTVMFELYHKFLSAAHSRSH